jgi:hypothetical protein
MKKPIYKAIFAILCIGGVLLLHFYITNRCYDSLDTVDKVPVSSSSIFEWIQKPAAVRFVGKYDRTYISWIKNDGKIQIRYYDHKTESFSNIYTVDDLYPAYRIEARDDHNAPSLLILPDGHIQIFYVVHDVDDAFFMKTSSQPEDIALWDTRVSIHDKETKNKYNYPQPKQLNDGNIFLFYRTGAYHDSNEYYKVSKDSGKTWSSPHKLLDFHTDGVYAFVESKGNQIHIAWNKSVDSPPKKNVYYVYSPDGGQTWRKKDNTILKLPVTEGESEVVFDSGDDPAYVWDITIDDDYNPFIVFSYKNDPHHEFRYAQWQDSSWMTTKITTSSLLYDSGHFFSGGIVINPHNMYEVYLSKKHTYLELESWISEDGGLTWYRSEEITHNSAVDNFRPQVVENYSDSLRLVWSSGVYEGLVNNHWTGFDKVNIQSDVTKGSIPVNKCSLSGVSGSIRNLKK